MADYVEAIPPVRNATQLTDLSARFRWYLGDSRVPLFVEDGTKHSIGSEHAPWMDPPLATDPAGDGLDLQERRTMWFTTWAAERWSGLRGEGAGSPSRAGFLLHGRGGLFPAQKGSRDNPVARSWKLGRTPAQTTGAGWGRVGAGHGSVKPIGRSRRVEADIRVTCNSAVRDLDLLKALRVDVIAINDPVFHFGPSRYAAAFRRDLVRALKETRALVVTTTDWAEPLVVHCPDVAERLVVLDTDKSDQAPWRWPTTKRPVVRSTGNVLTLSMLPVAFALADEVHIAGADGRRASERYFWRHNQRIQYSDDLMNSAFQAHPAFFRDRDYGDYYKQHICELDELLNTAERVGKRAVPVTPSWIPALVKRGAPQPD